LGVPPASKKYVEAEVTERLLLQVRGKKRKRNNINKKKDFQKAMKINKQGTRPSVHLGFDKIQNFDTTVDGKGDRIPERRVVLTKKSRAC